MFKYTTRKDGRLMKKVILNGKVNYLYSNNSNDLERQYIELKHLSLYRLLENYVIFLKLH